MAIPTDEELDAYGVVQLAKEWTPRGMYSGSGKDLFDALHAMEAFALNPGYAFAEYVPDAFDPYLCLDEELKAVARIHGVHVHDWSVDKQILRRLCLVAQQARAWRGASTSLLAVISAVTGAQTMVVPWTALRTVLDVSSMDMTLTGEDESEFTIAFVVANGSGYGGFPDQELQHRIGEMSVQALDYVTTVDCFAVTSWRNGRNGWSTSGTLVESGIRDEYEALDIGPAVDATTDQFIITNYQADAATEVSSDSLTVWFKTSEAVAGDYWEAYLFADDAIETCYMVRVRVGNYSATIHRIDAGVVGSALGTFAFNISDGLDGEYHRLDFKAVRTSTKTRLRVYVDGNPSAFYDDATVAGRPSGGYAAVGLNTSNFTSGTLRIAAVVARRIL